MKWQRCTTSTPGQSVSTMNAVICFFSLPLTIFDGVRAITTSSSALVPLVHHSFSPFRTHVSSSRIAVVSFAVDLIGVHVLAQEPLELIEERFGAGDFVSVLFGVGMD